MPVRITGRHVEITKALRAYIDKKLPRIEKYTDKIQNIDFVVEKDSYNHRVELRLKAGTISVNANCQDPDLLRAVDLLIDKVERQLSKKSDRMRDKRASETSKKSMPALLDEGEGALLGKNGKSNTAAKSRKASAKPGRTSRSSNREMPILAENVGVHIFQRGRRICKRMDLHEAAEELFFTDENFLCFENEGTRKLAVMYRRQDGNFGVIDLHSD